MRGSFAAQPRRRVEGDDSQAANADETLWKVIEPCWRRLATPGTQGVVLRIGFSPFGNIATTLPAGDGPETAAQAVAIEALNACGPYVGAGSRENVVISFPAVP